MDEINGIYFLMTAAVAAVFSGAFGFGAALILIPIGAMFMSLKEVIAFASIFFIFLNVSKIFFYWNHIVWKTMFSFLLGSIPFAVLGAFLMLEVNEFWLGKFVGIMLLSYVVFKKFGGFNNAKLSKKGIATGGAIYGFLTGLTGMGNFAKVATLSHIGLNKIQFVATMAVLPLVTTLLRVSIYSRGGFYNTISWQVILGFAVCAIFGTYLGRHFLRKMTQHFFDNAILAILFFVAMKFLIF